ncbi:DEKNAAC102769 [Brettanomyces naardenensis]|uniref:DEKNAAC102769 n=1 Tax=Brettanomyces naardenensis TaxID=13370 RepID=A0A448YL95_BRENA|nr:DEKNAAC102769 [Brettanomyces naardenensis]
MVLTSQASSQMKSRDLVNKYKRQGHFDSKRRQLLEEFQEGSSGVKDKLDELLVKLIDLKTEKNPELLVENRGKLVALIQASLTKERMYSGPTQEGITDYSGLKSDNGRTNTGKDNTEEENEIIKEINRLLNGYVSDVVTNNEGLNKELEDSLNELAGSADINAKLPPA